MANELPEVVPDVQSMPTTGWFCQTSGNARRRITKNTSSLDTEGIYDVAGVPGHTHNANAVVSADADYSSYRQSALNVGAHIWGYDALGLPIGLLTDSVEPAHAEERYERAIERCVGYVSLFPENCTGHIQEPTRSIGEIRTLVAPKSRLDTLTYVEERRGWRVPKDADDHKETTEREALVSDFPDVYIDVRPLTLVEPATINLGVSPASLYLETATHRYRIVDAGTRGFIGYTAASDQTLRQAQATRTAAAAAGDAGPLATAEALVASATAARAASWDGTLRFVWDYDSRSYKMESALSVILNDVREIARADGVGLMIYDYDPQNVAGAHANGVPTAQPAAANHATRITVTFGIQETTPAFDGFCWLGNLNNEEALNYAARNNGLALAPRFDVEVIGVQVNLGPFKWIGTPAYRIPVGGAYAHPCSDILQQSFGNGLHGDRQYNYWDKFDAFRQDATAAAPFDGFLRYQWRSEEASRAHAATNVAFLLALAAAQNAPNDAALAQEAIEWAALELIHRAELGNDAFDLTARAAGTNGGMFYPRTGGILRQVTADQYDPQPDFTEVAANAYAVLVGGLADDNLITPGIQLSTRHKFDANAQASAAAQCAPVIYDADGNIHSEGAFAERPFSPFGDMVGPTSFTLKSTTSFTFPHVPFPGVPAALAPFVSDRFCVVPMTPLFYKITDALAEGGVGNFSDNNNAHDLEKYLGKVVNGARRLVPKVICNCSAVVGDQLQLRYDLSDVMFTERGYRFTGGSSEVPGAKVLGSYFWIRGWSFWVHPDDVEKSNFDPDALNLPAEGDDAMRNTFRDNFRTGNKFVVPAGSWKSEDVDGGACLTIYDYVFALPLKDFGGLYFETANASVNNAHGHSGRKVCFFAHKSAAATDLRPRSSIMYEAAGGAGTAFVNGRIFTGAGGGMECYVWDQHAGFDALEAADHNVVRRATHGEIAGELAQDLNMYILGPDWFRTHIGNDPYGAVRNDSMRTGAVFQSIKRISQHICAPVINPNLRIGASAPLNHDTRHLPPELRDFRLQLHSIDWGRLQANKVTLNELSLYDFKGGVQKVGAAQNILYLPQFREFKRSVTDNKFSVTLFSELGSPSYFCFFCRSATTDILQQPRIKTLSIFNETTKKKSNSIQELSAGQLFHLTQRNVHPAAEYTRAAYLRRQTVLLSAEDVGLMGLKSYEYQKAKRVEYTFSGTTERPGQLYIVLVYNNRGLHIDGRRLQVVTLHE